MGYLVDIQKVWKAIELWHDEIKTWPPGYSFLLDTLKAIPPADGWIPFTFRGLTIEEKEEHPDWKYIFDGKLPEDGQEIIVTINRPGYKKVQIDEFCEDDECYLDSGYDIGTEAIAWMPFPEPYDPNKKEEA